jgi:DNA-binding response OmpR family regulator/DNA-binding CsgD family transcriptional regulator
MKNNIILVVDDEIFNLKIHIEFLIEANQNYEILQANSGKMALEIIKKKKPDLILLDWEMPDISGIDVIKSLRNNKETSDIAIIIITGMMTSSMHLKEALETGAVDFMRKPVDRIEFNARVRSMLQFIDIYREKLRNEQEINRLLNETIEFKDRELASNTLFMAKQNTEIIKIVDELKDSFNGLSSNKIKALFNEAVIKLKSKVDISIWDDFKLRFEKVHPQFSKKLLEICSDISPTEHKLSILLRLNLSSKEIAKILSIQVDSVKTARSRLRKKLNIASDSNLYNFLASL